MPDRDQQIRMFDTVVEFLRVNNFPHPLPEAKKFFSSVSTTESTRLLEFLIGQIYPDYKITRLEMDVPEALRQLNYPNIRAVTKSALVSVTTRQAVVGLLSIFNWLVTCINEMNSDEDFVISDDDAPLSQGRIVASIMIDKIELDQEKQLEILDKFNSAPDLEEAQKKLSALEAERERVESENEEIRDLLDKKKALFDDLEEYEKYQVHLIDYLKKKEKEETEIKELEEKTEPELNRLRNAIHNLSIEVTEDRLRHVDMIEEKYQTTQARLKDQDLKNQEKFDQMTRRADELIKKRQQLYDEELIVRRKSIDEKSLYIKQLRSKHDSFKSRQIEINQSREKFRDQLRNETLKRHAEYFKKAESVKQNFITNAEQLQDIILRKGSIVDELHDRKDRELEESRILHKKFKKLLKF